MPGSGGEITDKKMSSNQKFIDLSKELIASVNARDGLLMQQKMDALELAYKNEFPDRLGCYEDVFAYVLMSLASARYFAYNNMYGQVAYVMETREFWDTGKNARLMW